MKISLEKINKKEKSKMPIKIGNAKGRKPKIDTIRMPVVNSSCFHAIVQQLSRIYEKSSNFEHEVEELREKLLNFMKENTTKFVDVLKVIIEEKSDGNKSFNEISEEDCKQYLSSEMANAANTWDSRITIEATKQVYKANVFILVENENEHYFHGGYDGNLDEVIILALRMNDRYDSVYDINDEMITRLFEHLNLD